MLHYASTDCFFLVLWFWNSKFPMMECQKELSPSGLSEGHHFISIAVMECYFQSGCTLCHKFNSYAQL